MTAPGIVHADVFVRSRDGRSLLDRGTEPIAAFTPDPVRVRAAVAGLEEAGLTVDAVKKFTVAVHGPPAAFTTAFAVQLEFGTAWHVAHLPGRGTFTVDAAALPLGAVVHGALLQAPRRAFTRALYTPKGAFDQGPAVPLAQDLLLGEIGALTLGDDVPQRATFPATKPDEALDQTRTLLDEWDGSLYDTIHDRAGTSVWTRLPKRLALRAVVDGEVAARTLGDLWDLKRRGSRGEVRLPVISGRIPVATSPDAWVVLGDGEGDAFYGEVRPAWRLASTLVAVFTREPAAAGAGLPVRWAAAEKALTATLDAIDGLRTDTESGNDDLHAAAKHLRAALGRRTATGGVDDYRTAWHDAAAAVDAVDEQLRRRDAVHRRRFPRKLLAAHWHAAMVGHAFLAVSRRLVHLRMPTRVAEPEPLAGRRTIISVSSGRCDPAADQLTRSTIRTEALARAEKVLRVELRVIAIGNNPEADGDPKTPNGPNLDACLVADQENVLVVGGCRPDGTTWLATEMTHGYAYTPPGVANAVDLPHICATTKGESGGAVVFPDTEDPTGWWLGQGSSLAAPIVAAVCGLVWTYFPHLSAGQVKEAVLSSEVKLGGGTFDTPEGTTAPASVTGIPRVHLGKALETARTLVAGAPLLVRNAP